MASSLCNVFRFVLLHGQEVKVCREVTTTASNNFFLKCGENWHTFGSRSFNSNRSTITRIRRKTYTRLYPTLLVQPDGSTLKIRYHVPIKIIKLPIDTSLLTEEERKRHADKHKAKQKIIIKEEIEDDFDYKEYSHLWKKR